MALMRSIMTVGGHTVISRILGYVRDAVTAHLLGAGAITDAFMMAVKIPGVVRRLFAEGAFNSAFVPIFAGNLTTKGRQSAKVFAEHAIVILALALIALVILVEIFMPQFVNILAPGFSTTPERLHYTIEFTRITFPFIIFICMSAILGGVLNSLDRFAAPASAQSIGNLFIIVCFTFFAQYAQTGGHLASWGNLGSGIIQFIWLYFFCALAGMPLRIRRPRLTPEIREFFRKLLPGMLGAGVFQINIFVDLLLCSFLPEGSVSYVAFADRINQLPLNLIAVAMGVALLPMLTKQLQQGAFEEALFTQNRATEFVLLVTVPAAIGIMIYSNEFVALIYDHGEFKKHSGNIIQTAFTLAAFSTGLPAYVLMKVFSSTFFARKDTLTPVIIALISVAINAAINWQLMKYYQHIGIAIGTALSSWANAILLAIVLKQRKMMVLDKQIITSVPKILTASAIMGLLVYHIEPYFKDAILSGSFIEKAALLCILIGIAVVAFLAPAYFLRCIDTKSMNNMMDQNTKGQA